MKNILIRYKFKEIGININSPFHIDPATLLEIENDHFTVKDHDKGYTHHFSYNSIVKIIECKEGIEIGGLFSHKKLFNIIVKVGHILEYVPPA